MRPPSSNTLATSSKISERRERLIAATRKLFAEEGFHKTGIARIAQSSGLLVGQIYRDFTSKEEIVAAIVERDLARLLAAEDLQAARCREDVAAVRFWIVQFMARSVAEATTGLYADILAEARRNDRIAAVLRCADARLRDALMAALERLAPGPEKAGRRAITAEIILTVSGGLFHRALTQESGTCTILAERLAAMIDGEIDALLTL